MLHRDENGVYEIASWHNGDSDDFRSVSLAMIRLLRRSDKDNWYLGTDLIDYFNHKAFVEEMNRRKLFNFDLNGDVLKVYPDWDMETCTPRIG